MVFAMEVEKNMEIRYRIEWGPLTHRFSRSCRTRRLTSCRLRWFLVCIWVLSWTAAQAQTSPIVDAGTENVSQEARQRAALRQFLSDVSMAKNNLGAVYFAIGNYDSAQVHLTHALEIAPNFAAAHLTLGLVHHANGDQVTALKEFKNAAAGDTIGVRRMDMVPPDTVFSWAKAQFDQMMKSPPQLAFAHTELAIAFNQGGYLADAEHHYLQSIRHDSTYMAAYTNLGKLYADVERFEEAIRLYEKVAAASVDADQLPKVYLNLGVSYMGSGHPEEAIVAWSKAVALAPDYAEAYMNLGIAYQSKDMPDSARTVWTRALGVKSDLVVARVALARLEAGEGRKDEAIQYYQDILDMGGKDPRLYAELGQIYEQYEQFDLAISNYEAAVALDPASAELLTFLYRVKSKTQDREAARQANKIRVRQIVVRSQLEAEAILTQLDTGVDFTELARTKSIDPNGANGGDLGFFGPGEMIPTFEEAAMGLQVGEVSDVIRTSLGFHIIKRIE